MPGKPRSEDLRVRAIDAVLGDGLSRREAARRFKVGDASVIRWVAAYEADGRTKPLPGGRRKASKLDAHRDWLLDLRRSENDLTLEAMAERLLAEHGVATDKSRLSRFFKAEGISFKKNRSRQRAGAAGRGRGARRMAKDAA
jgi:transposase